MELVFYVSGVDAEMTRLMLQKNGTNIFSEIRNGESIEAIHAFAEEIVQNNKLGVFFTTDGEFHSMLLNKIKGIRAALAYSTYEGGMTRKHNDANMLILDVSVLGSEFLQSVIEPYSKETFEYSEAVLQHKKRVEKLHLNEK